MSVFNVVTAPVHEDAQQLGKVTSVSEFGLCYQGLVGKYAGNAGAIRLLEAWRMFYLSLHRWTVEGGHDAT